MPVAVQEGEDLNTHHPRQVHWLAPIHWAREAMLLMARRPWAYGLASLGMLAVFVTVLRVENAPMRLALVLALPPMAIAGFLRLAAAADRGRALAPLALIPSNRDAARILILALVGYAAALALLTAVQGGDPLALLESDKEPDAWRTRLQALLQAAARFVGVPAGLLLKAILFGASITAFGGILLALCAWFVLPLMQFADLPLVPAALLSWRAVRLNVRCMAVTHPLVLLLTLVVLLATLGVATVLAAPFMGSVLYVSYRDVFLGRAQNAPAPIRREVQEAIPSRA